MSPALMPVDFQFTVFTPTYNRAHTLHRVYDSLRAQTFRDFEWLVVDDGSTDGTEELIARWAAAADFPVRYLRQQQSGKHVAHNRGVAAARGLLFAPLDSDDALLPDALERIARYWNEIPETDRQGFSGLGGLCCDQNGNAIGDPFPSSPMDSDLREILFVHGLRGEKWGVSRTEIFSKFPFPEVAGTQFVPEGMVGLQMAVSYKRRYFNEVFRVYYIDASESGDNLSNRLSLVKSAPGRLYYYIWLLNNNMSYIRHAPVPFLKAAAMLFVASQYSGEQFRAVWRQLTDRRARLLVLAALPFSVALYAYYRCGGLQPVDRAKANEFPTDAGIVLDGVAPMKQQSAAEAPLTDRSYWNETWKSVTMPALIDLSDHSLRNHVTQEFHRYFSEMLKAQSRVPVSLVEIGCAQSKWLPYFSKTHGLKVGGVDFSELGCARARELLARAGCEGEIVQGDMFAPPEALRGRFDVVVSMGLVEHFPDTSEAVRAIAAFVRPGGLVLTLIPNMTGLTGFGQRWLDRSVYEKHVPLDSKALTSAHSAAGLTVLRSDYLMSVNLALINHPNLRPKILERLARGVLVSITGFIWALERAGLRMPPTQSLSPYVAVAALKPA